MWTFGTNAGNIQTVAIFTTNIYANPVEGTAGAKLTFASDGYVEFTTSASGYLGAYVGNNMGTTIDDYLIDITDL